MVHYRYMDITNKRFGRLVAISVDHKDKHGTEYWNCVCDCGNKVVVRKNHLTGGKIVSCKCYQKEQILKGTRKQNGLYNTRINRIWKNMKNRCYYTKHPEFKYWGGRGITVCPEWKESFLQFYDWAMSHGYQDNLSIDRIDVDGNYCPENCRWTTASQQALNKRKNKCSVVA